MGCASLINLGRDFVSYDVSLNQESSPVSMCPQISRPPDPAAILLVGEAIAVGSVSPCSVWLAVSSQPYLGSVKPSRDNMLISRASMQHAADGAFNEASDSECKGQGNRGGEAADVVGNERWKTEGAGKGHRYDISASSEETR